MSTEPINRLESGVAATLTERFIAGDTIVSKSLVKRDVSQTGADAVITVIPATAGGRGEVVGVAMEAASSGDHVLVAVQGYVSGALTDGSVTASGSLCSDASAACTLYAGTEAYVPFAFALKTDTGTETEIYLFGC